MKYLTFSSGYCWYRKCHQRRIQLRHKNHSCWL